MSHVERRVQAGRVTYRARWRDPSGRERKRSFNRKTDAQRFLVGIEDAKLRGAYVAPAKGKVGFGEWAERWFATTADLKPATRRTYRLLVDNQVLPHFGGGTLAGIDTLAIREWVATLVEGGLSPLTRYLARCSRLRSRAGGWPATRPPGYGCPSGSIGRCCS